MKEIIYSCSSRGEPAGSWIDHGLEGKQKHSELRSCECGLPARKTIACEKSFTR